MQFGARWTLTAFLALLWPLVVSLLAGNATVTLVVYPLAFIVDLLLFGFWLRAALSCSARAGRGETFEGAR